MRHGLSELVAPMIDLPCDRWADDVHKGAGRRPALTPAATT